MAQEINIGDRVSIDAKKIGQVRRSGVVTGISQGISGARYTVAWDHGGTSVFTPGSGNLTKEAGGRRRSRPAADAGRKKASTKSSKKASSGKKASRGKTKASTARKTSKAKTTKR